MIFESHEETINTNFSFFQNYSLVNINLTEVQNCLRLSLMFFGITDYSLLFLLFEVFHA